MDDGEFRAELARLHDEDKRQNRRIEALELVTKQIQDLTISVHQLAHNMGQMLDEQKDQGRRLAEVEKEPIAALKKEQEDHELRLAALEAVPAKNWKRVTEKALETAVAMVAGGIVAGIAVIAVQYIK